MKYYKVLDDQIIYHCRTHKWDYLFENELYTEKELIKKVGVSNLTNTKIFKVVNISKNNTYWSFGARFECRGNTDEK